MNIKFLVFFFLAFTLSCHRIPQRTQFYELRTNWDVGDVFKYKFIKTKHEVRFGLEFPEARTDQIAVLEVIGKDVLGYELEWSIEDVLVPEGKDIDRNSMTQFKSMIDTFSIRYKTNVDGQFSELLNWEDVLEFNLKLMDEAAKVDGRFGTEKYNEIRKGLVDMFGTKEQVTVMFVPEIQLLHSLYGIRMGRNESTSIPKQIPNIFGGNDVPVVVNYSISNIDKHENTLEGVEDFDFDEELKRNLLMAFINGMKPGYAASVDIEEEMKSTELSYTDRKDFNINYQNGIIHKLYFERNMILKNTGIDLIRKESTLFEKI